MPGSRGEQIQDLTPRVLGLEWVGFHEEERSVLPRAAAVLATLCLLAPALVPAAEDEKPKKDKKPALELRVSPRYAFSPVNAFFTAELKGGDDVEDLYCPEVEWEWGDGGKSVHESDCDPWAAGTMKIDRRFTGNHLYPQAGLYLVKVTLRKTGKSILSQTLQITIRAGLGDTSPDPGGF